MQCTTISAGAKTARIIARKATGIPASLYTPARPALFRIRGHLMAFKKCTAGVPWSKGRRNFESVRLTV